MNIFRKSLLTLSLAALGLSAVMVVSVLASMNSLYYETNANALRDTANAMITLAGEDRLADYFAEGRGDFSYNPGVYRLTLIDRAGYVLWDSQIEGTLVNHINREEVLAALAGNEGSARRNSLNTGMRQIYSALPIHAADGNVIGVFRLSLDIPDFWQRISPAGLSFLLFAGLLAVIGFAAIAAFSRSLSVSLARLVSIAQTAAGDSQNTEQLPLVSVSGEAIEFLALETALRSMTSELNLRIEQARAEGRKLEAILDGISEAVLAMDEKFILHLVNPCARTLFGTDKDQDLRGLSLLEAVRSTELEQIAKKVLAEGRSLDMELRLHTAGMEQLFQVFASPFYTASAETEKGRNGIVMVLTDVTRLVRLEQVRKDFVANVSHELRTPIQLIKGFSENLEDSSFEDKEQTRRFIKIIHKNAGVMENLTDDLLVLAGLENGDSAHSDMEEQQLAPLFADAIISVESQARKKRIEIIDNCPADLKAKVHGSFITQALINLLDNAIKYSPEKSRVWASAFRENGETTLEVKDEGIGISAEHLERIFERFYRIDRVHSREAGGTGLGLSIVRHIALLHRGIAQVESHAGEGSVFRIKFP
ncbi:MAG: PAS domain-containing protein [Treponema sp.]|jgi:two-component system phosphate regulon sensor histidine kinase PhoR|nr:PAS domain-containing protein [Treponema sp.]